MGLGIGLSGALIPGPLLVFNITETLKHGAKTGFLVILGHFFVEVCVSLLIIFGFLKFSAIACCRGGRRAGRRDPAFPDRYFSFKAERA